MNKKDTSAVYMTVLSDHSVAFKEIDDHVVLFVAEKDGWMHVFRYREDGIFKKIDRFRPALLEMELKNFHIDVTSGFKIFEEYENQEILERIKFLL